jgi:hypothetical protein
MSAWRGIIDYSSERASKQRRKALKMWDAIDAGTWVEIYTCHHCGLRWDVDSVKVIWKPDEDGKTAPHCPACRGWMDPRNVRGIDTREELP